MAKQEIPKTKVTCTDGKTDYNIGQYPIMKESNVAWM